MVISDATRTTANYFVVTSTIAAGICESLNFMVSQARAANIRQS